MRIYIWIYLLMIIMFNSWHKYGVGKTDFEFSLRGPWSLDLVKMVVTWKWIPDYFWKCICFISCIHFLEGEKCGEVYLRTSSATWNDAPCDLKFGYICETFKGTIHVAHFVHWLPSECHRITNPHWLLLNCVCVIMKPHQLGIVVFNMRGVRYRVWCEANCLNNLFLSPYCYCQ